MEPNVSPNNSKEIKTNTAIEEEFEYMTKEEAAKKSFRTRLPLEEFKHYAERIDELTPETIGIVTSSDLKQTRKNLLLVAKKLNRTLSTKNTVDGLHFWLATKEEIQQRKKLRKK